MRKRAIILLATGALTVTGPGHAQETPVLAPWAGPVADAIQAAMDRAELPAPTSGEAGREALARSQWHLALRLLDSYLARAPLGTDGERAELDRAQVLARSGDATAAADALQAFRQQWPGSEAYQAATFTLASLLFVERRYQDAIPVLQQYQSQWPESEAERVAYALGWCYQQLKQYPEAERAFRGGLERVPGGKLSAHARLGLADTYWAWGRVLAAAQAYAAVGRQTGDQDLRDRGAYLAGEAYGRQGNWDAAIGQYRQVAPNRPWGVQAQYGLAYAYLQARRPADALPVLTRWLQQHPDHRWSGAVHFLVGCAQLSAAAMPEAATAFGRSLSSDADGIWAPAALYGQAQAEFRLAKYADSTEHCRELLRRFPESGLAGQGRQLLGEALYQQGQYQAAIQHLGTPEVGGAGQRALGFAYFRSGEYAAALQAWSTFRDPEVQFYRAQAQLGLGQAEAAAIGFADFLQTNPTSMRLQEALFGLGSALARGGKYEEALGPLSELEHAARPELARAATLLRTDALVALKRFADARSLLERLQTGAPDEAGDAAFKIGWTWLQEGNPSQARTAWERYRAKYPLHRQVADALYHEGEIQMKAKAYPQAVASFNAVLAQPSSRAELRAQALMRLADAAIGQGDYDRAGHYFQQVQQGFPDRKAEAVRGWLRAISAGPDLDAAIAAVQAYRKDQPDDPAGLQALDYVGQRLVAGGRYADALALLGAHPHPGGATLFWLGRAQRGAGQTAVAEATFNRLVEAHEGFEHSALDQLAQMAFAGKEFDRAIASWQRLLSQTPPPAATLAVQTRFNLAVALALANQAAQAEALLRELSADASLGLPQRLEAQRRLGALLRGSNRLTDAIAVYEQLVKQAGKPSLVAAEAQYWIGHSLAAGGAKPEALAALAKVASLTPPADPRWLAQALFKQAELLEDLGRWRQAVEAYQRIAGLKTEATWRTDAQARVRWIQQHIPAKEWR